MRCWRCDWNNPANAITCVHCGAVLAPRSPLSEATRAGMRAVGADPHGRPPSAVSAHTTHAAARRRQRTLTVTITLAILVALIGFGAVRAAELLQRAMRPPTDPAQLAATICTAYLTQNYGMLTAQIDPTPVPPANSDAFNPNVIQTQLRSLDKIDGVVQRCDPGHFAAIGAGGQFPLSLQRTRVTAPITVTLILRSQSDGSWKVSRETSFSGTQGG